jgi:SNF2 family DNA or RNA helicase
MISKKAKEEYLKKDQNDWSWIKEVPKKTLWGELHHYYPGFIFKTLPYKHQLASIFVGLFNTNFLFLLDMGSGKSALVLSLISIIKNIKKKIGKILILVPNVVSVGNWGEEIEKHSDFSWVDLVGTKETRLENLEKDVDIYLLNHAGLHVLLANRPKKKGKLTKSIPKIDKFAKRFDAMVIDEIHQNFGNHKSLSFEIANELSERIPYRYGLTGTPVGRDPMILWSQFYLIDHGETLGNTISFYREIFFNTKVNYWGGYEYSFKKSMEGILNKKLRNKSIRYSEEEIGDLPPKIYKKIYVTFPEENFGYYKKVADGLKEVMVKGVNKKLLENAFIKLRQVTAGFLDFKNDESGEKQTLIFSENPKLDALEGLILSLPANEKFLVFNEFTKSGAFISKRLKKLGVEHERLYGGTKDKEKARDRFLRDPKCRGFVVNSKSGSVSLNLQVARYCIFYESPVSCIVRRQAEKRCHRTGSTGSVFYYDLVIKGSIDEKILGFISQGKDIFQALIEGKNILEV